MSMYSEEAKKNITDKIDCKIKELEERTNDLKMKMEVARIRGALINLKKFFLENMNEDKLTSENMQEYIKELSDEVADCEKEIKEIGNQIYELETGRNYIKTM